MHEKSNRAVLRKAFIIVVVVFFFAITLFVGIVVAAAKFASKTPR